MTATTAGDREEPARPTFRCARCGKGSIGAYDPLNRRATTIAERQEKDRRRVCLACYRAIASGEADTP